MSAGSIGYPVVSPRSTRGAARRVVAVIGLLLLALTLERSTSGSNGAGESPSQARPFAASSAWNTQLPAQASWRDEPLLRADHWWMNYEEFSIPVVYATASDPVVSVDVPATWGWPAGVELRIPAAVTGAAGTDGALIVISGDVAHNFWQFRRTDRTHGVAEAYARANIVTGTGFGSADPFLGAGIRAAGSSELAGLITGHDTESGIHHALAVSLLATELRDGFVAPAIAQDTAGGYGGTIPMGSRLGIPRGTPTPTGLSPFGRSIWDALVDYGAFVVDQHVGTVPVILYADPFSVDGELVNEVRVASGGKPSDLDRIMPFLRVLQG